MVDSPHNTNPIFIVGSPRSGTTLLSAMLSSHSQLSCGPETQFFSKLTQDTLQEAECPEGWPHLAVEALLSLTLSKQPVHKLFGETRGSLSEYLTIQKPSIAAMLEALCKRYAIRQNKPRWIEKTPNHILYLEKIRELYPNAKIIRIMRDPRDSVLSMQKLPWTSNSFVENSYLWMEWYEKSLEFLENDSHCITVKYEDVMQNPEQKLKEICSFIGEDFEYRMLNTAETGKNVSSAGEPWKERVSRPLDTSRMYVWKKSLSHELQSFSSIIFENPIKKFGYEGPSSSSLVFEFYPSERNTILKNEKSIVAAAKAGIKLSAANRSCKCKKLLFLPDFQSNTKTQAIKSIVKMMVFLTKRRVRGERSFYLEENSFAATGLYKKVYCGIMCLLAEKYSL